ncbi:MAG: hypothetical protein HN736_12785 [Anaerolineae bacterium]|jgi:hypothetical protein|nr:hypothetical protein [Anaerolineae bacterium]MBT3714664.1 hypothetical protein [Anaerolineae bacterium]MBT4310037.1 hypothetical protein [Anaerolineae bacterium]MBT4457447.1 hypothetical protein [Anaerolineae bacterium]MBT4843037.1 hypothetical protein [Anaerolineae bacterium]
MTFEYDNKGKFFTDVISKTPIDVLVQTTTHLIQGTIHIHRDERLKDELDRGNSFLALTEASVLNAEGKTLYKNEFLAVQTNQVVWVIPEENDQEEKSIS